MSKRNRERNGGTLPAEVPDDISFDPAELEKDLPTDEEPPEGFDIDAELIRADGWAEKGEGYVIMGRLLGRQEFRGGDGKPRAFYSVQLAKPARAVIGTGDDAEKGILQKGQICNVDDSAALSQLIERSKDGNLYDVWIRYGAKEKLAGKNQTFWPADVKLKLVKRVAAD